MKKVNPFRIARYVISAHQLKQLPEDQGIEVAIAGRSNAGKSSAINTFTDQRSLARTSKTPGRTQQIVIFELDENRRIADLPGYGYARVPVSVRKKWGPMIETYLSSRKTLKGVVIIMDIRRQPREEEQNLIHWLDHFSIAQILVLTKTDKLSKTKLIKQQDAIVRALAVGQEDVILFSAKTRRGKDAVWDAILTLTNIKKDNTN